jgi:hypothetical protein
MNAQAARSRRLPTGRRGQYSGGSLRIVSGLAENTNSIICDGSGEPETANGCPVLHRMRGPPAVRHSCATLNPDQSNARSRERAQRPCAFFLTSTYMEVGNPYLIVKLTGFLQKQQCLQISRQLLSSRQSKIVQKLAGCWEACLELEQSMFCNGSVRPLASPSGSEVPIRQS